MFRAKWSTIVAAALSCCGPVLAQQPATNVPRVVTIQEEGKPAMQCRVLKTWKEGGSVAFEVQSLTTGERITLVESGPVSRYVGSGKVVQEVRSHIYHWAHNTRPADAPMAPADAIVPGMPGSPVQMAQTTAKPAVPPATTPSAAAPVAKVTPAVNTQLAPALATVTPVVRTAEAPAAVTSATPPLPSAGPVATPAPASSNASVAPAQPSDWHQSWGKANDHKSDAPPATSAVERPPSHMPPKEDLPQAVKTSADPLADPEIFSPYRLKNKDGAMPTLQVKPGEGVNAKKDEKPDDSSEEASAGASDKKIDPSSAEHKDENKKPDSDKADAAKPGEKNDAKPAEKNDSKPAAKKPEQGATLGERFKSFFTRKEADKPKAEPAEEEDPSSMGMRSVYAAGETGMPKPAPSTMPPGAPAMPVVTLTDTDPSNAFTTVVRRHKAKTVPAEQMNAFDGTAQQTPSMPPYQVPQGMPPVAPQGYVGVPPAPPGMMPAYGYAPPPAGMVPVAYANPNMPRPGMMPTRPMMDRGTVASAANTAPGQASASSSPDGAQLMLVLRSSQFPSNREWAADQLANVEWQSNPVVVEMLLQSAKNDPAPTVREACVRNLGKMNANTPSVVEGLAALQKDENAGVRAEVTRTLSKFQIAAQPAVRSPIQPASMR